MIVDELLDRALKAEKERDELRLSLEEMQRNVDAVTGSTVNSAEIKAIGYLKRASKSFGRSWDLLSKSFGRNQEPESKFSYVANETTSSWRILEYLFRSGELWETVIPAWKASPLLISHIAAFYARADDLERYVPAFMPILERHLPSIEPHLDKILEEWEKIEPHLGYILDNIDCLAPHCGQLIEHIDELLLYADEDEEHSRYFPELLPYVKYFAPRLNSLAKAGHLTYLRPHLPKISPYLQQLAPQVDRFTPYPVVSANADVVIWYFGWALKTPVVRSIVQLWFMAPGTPTICSWLATHLPKRPVRGDCAGIECFADFDRYSIRLGVARFGTAARTWVGPPLRRVREGVLFRKLASPAARRVPSKENLLLPPLTPPDNDNPQKQRRKSQQRNDRAGVYFQW